MRKLSAAIGRPVTFALLQVEADPDLWKALLAESLDACEDGAQCYPQVAARPFGMLIGWQTHHAFAKRPTYIALADLPLEERIAKLGQPEVRAAILNEEDLPPDPALLFDGMSTMVQAMLHRLYPLGSVPDYEPVPERSVAAIAESRGVSPLEACYDLMLEDDGLAMLMFPIFNYAGGSHDAIREMLPIPKRCPASPTAERTAG